jgi:glycosyltransferase involved in cell wall biosynthesis
MRRVLLVQPSLQPPGGGNGVAAWMLQALVRQHRVTVLSWQPVDVGPVNRFFGTSLHASDFDRLLAPRPWRLTVDSLPIPAALLRSALMMRHTRRVSDAFDVIIGVQNEIDCGRRCIQYIHYPTYTRPRPAVDLRVYHRSKWLLDRYYRAADALGDFSIDRMKANLTLANSNWTAARVRDHLGINAHTVYPPVVGGGRDVAWAGRRTAFLAIGRISPEKEYDRVLRILARVRASVPALTITIAGTCDRHTRGYYARIRSLAAPMGPWVTFSEDLTREEVRALMAEARYGIHGMREEHFGMAPAEMARAGMIVWVPNGGGQVEIVGGEPALLYDTEEQAADAILRVIGDAAEQDRLRTGLAARSALFNEERFMSEIQSIVADFRE